MAPSLSRQVQFGGKKSHTGDRYETIESGPAEPGLHASVKQQMGEGRTFSRSLRGQSSQEEKRFTRQDTQKEKDKTLQKETTKC